MRWFFPSWNGDFRLEPKKDEPDVTWLVIATPTPDEKRLLTKLGAELLNKGWIKEWRELTDSKYGMRFEINAPLEKVGPLFISVFKPGPAVLTALKYENGKVLTCSGGLAELTELSEKVAEQPKKEQPKVAATVKRPTPCCPDCIPGSVEMASEVLLSFLSPEEHDTWAKERLIFVTGGMSGHRYRIAHRHSKIGQAQSRICYDLDADLVVHFHDWTVPPEEEVLATKLILEHREPWLRNEATMLGHRPGTLVFKNPFGSGMDGVPDAIFTSSLGRMLSGNSLT